MAHEGTDKVVRLKTTTGETVVYPLHRIVYGRWGLNVYDKDLDGQLVIMNLAYEYNIKKEYHVKRHNNNKSLIPKVNSKMNGYGKYEFYWHWNGTSCVQRWRYSEKGKKVKPRYDRIQK